MIPSPSAAAVATSEVVRRPGMIIPSADFVQAPGVLTVTMPGSAGSEALASYAAALLERIVSRMALPAGSLQRSF